jgi:AraC family transcriptional regulator of adaptative response/methylated-DNA-[protein]-cysteine methyltransferase
MTALEIDRDRPVTQPLDDARYAAVLSHDTSQDGRFFTCVTSTGIVCRPGCSARAPKRGNLFFVDTLQEALDRGFRPCKRCRPELPPKAEREAELIARACRAIEAAETEAALAELAAAAGLSPHHFHRLFKRIVGITPKAYAAAKRHARVKAELGEGAGVTEALYAAGYNSSGRFYEDAPQMLGMTPSAYRKGGQGQAIRYGFGSSSLGDVLVAATERGVCAIFMSDDREVMLGDLIARFPLASIRPLDGDHADWIAEAMRAVDNPKEAARSPLPLDILGTAFQRKVWEALQRIPAGETRTYGQLAADIGAPKAARAVGAACGANPVSVVVPCHRAVASTGDLTGYHWGIERKKKLLKAESE